MTPLAPILESFFTQRLITQRRVSPHTVASYRDTFRLLLSFAQQRIGKSPNDLELTDVDACLVSAFLDHLERERGNSARTRNARLVAVHSLFRHAALREPAHAGLIQRVLAIPQKRFQRAAVSYLNTEEITAILASPDRTTWTGRRDHALLVVAAQTGLRVSEIVSLRCQDVSLTQNRHIRCVGKGRKERCTPLTANTIRVLREWTSERGGTPDASLFPSVRGAQLSRDAVERLLTKHTTAAIQRCPSLKDKTITPHVLRHYVDGWVMWPVRVFPLAGVPRGPVPAT